MGFSFILFIVTLLLSCLLVHCGPLSYQPLTPNFTASFLNFVDTSGAFLSSPNGTFKAAITNIKSQERSYYFVIIHSDSHVVVWSANRNLPVSDSAELRLSVGGLALFDDSGDPIWSTKPFHSRNTSTTSLQLLETGNLVLVDDLNSTVWESFDFPTDTVVLGQRLPIRKSLISSVKEDELAEGDYDFFVADNDAMLKWNEMTYWKLTMEAKAFRDTNTPVEYMTIKSNGLFLLGANGTDIAIQVVLEELKSPDFRIAKLEDNGHFSVKRFSERNWLSEFNAPSDSCRVAFTCKKLGVCGGGRCSCPPGFRISSEVNGSCAPTDRNLVMPVSCNASLNANITDLGNRVSYLRLENGMDYFANDFTEAKMHGVNLSVCQDFCSKNCSCLGVFHDQSSGSCYMIENILGSILRGSDSDRLGYIKVFSKPSSFDPNDNSGDDKSRFPVVALVLLPSSGVLFIIVITAGIIWLVRRKKLLGNSGKKLGRADSSSSAEFDNIFILGLPVKFDYEEIRVATEDFRTQIGSGGFGTVYKGTVSDGSVVAVKKMNCLGSHGKREFCTEIAIIGRVHHVNLVSLKGFGAHRGERFLVYEYMNRGSLDRTLFGNGPALDWLKRFDIALGTARGLAYLHGGCEHKIIHCDVKPENILLHDSLQVKISDFGLSKLLNPEQSSWFTTMRGTRGYLAPEWLTSSAITEKSDVYSYGMLLLEIVRGKKNSSFQPPNVTTSESNSSERNRLSPSSLGSANQPIYFPLFALEMHEQKKYMELVDPRVLGRVKSEEVEKLVRIALCCLHQEPTLRPTMANVVGMLEGVLPLGEPQVQSLNFLRFYGRRFTESMIEGDQEVNVCELHQQNRNLSSNSSSSYNSFSYMSSQQVSGPR
ncbi:hypothetical protein K7X08_031100 [Anisodus acutangulus]|uniref:Receptor-like serine/threonine-protein kinase n=1 Tax=Anisodus acutangulus TaxID=402998 RepID=A0A9Q1MKS3_9SOLA|nr:hypothetical protein K7X08_031100 [Anisodus acutangulus]